MKLAVVPGCRKVGESLTPKDREPSAALGTVSETSKTFPSFSFAGTGALHCCEPARTALLLLDRQHGFLAPGALPAVTKGRAIIPRIRALRGGYFASLIVTGFTTAVCAAAHDSTIAGRA